MSVKAIAPKKVLVNGGFGKNVEVSSNKSKQPQGFKYSGFDGNGQKITRANIPFDTLEEANFKLANAGINVTSIKPISEIESFFNFEKRSKPNKLDMASLADNIAAQYTTGLTFDKIAKILARSHPKEQLREKLAEVAKHISDGKSASIAFAQPVDKSGKSFFSQQFIYCFTIGERIGALPDPETDKTEDAPVIMLRYFAKAQRISASLTKQIISGLTPTAAILIACFLAFFFLMYFLVPQYAGFFQALLSGGDTKLPFATQIMIDISNFFFSPIGYALTLSLATLISFSIYYFGFNPKGIEKGGYLILKIPVLKEIFIPQHGAAFCRNLSIMTAEPDSSARFHIVAETTDNPAFRDLAFHCREQIIQGTSFNNLFNGHLHLMGESFAPLAETIEANPGKASQLLYTYALYLEDKAHENLKRAISTLQNVAWGLSACLVGFILIAAYSPLLEIVGRLSKR